MHLAVPLVEDFLKVALRFEVKIFEVFSIVYSFGVDFFVADQDRLPDLFLHFFKVDVEVLAILDAPEGVIYLDTFVELAVDQGLRLALDQDLKMLGFDLTNDLASMGARRKFDLNIYVQHLLRPFVARCSAAIVRANGLVNINVSACWQGVRGCHCGDALAKRRLGGWLRRCRLRLLALLDHLSLHLFYSGSSARLLLGCWLGGLFCGRFLSRFLGLLLLVLELDPTLFKSFSLRREALLVLLLVLFVEVEDLARVKQKR